jgi:hypothetical protein
MGSIIIQIVLSVYEVGFELTQLYQQKTKKNMHGILTVQTITCLLSEQLSDARSVRSSQLEKIVKAINMSKRFYENSILNKKFYSLPSNCSKCFNFELLF